MTDLLTFIPLLQETEESIRARLDADINAGISPDAEDFVDTREGSFYWDITQAIVLELARLRDMISLDFPAAAFVPYSWGEYLDAHAETLALERKPAAKAGGNVTFTGTASTVIGTGTQVGTVQTDPNIDPPTFVTTQSGVISGASIDLTVEAAEAGVAGNVSAGAITELLSPIQGVASVANATGLAGGADAENDEALRDRILLEYGGRGAGVINDYKRWALSYPGVGRVTVIPIWNGPGTVQVVVMDITGDPVSGAIVNGLQALLDPVPQEGRGLAPIGAQVTVQTPAIVGIVIEAQVLFQENYSLDGAGGSIATRSSIEVALAEYINKLEAGDDVIFNHVQGQFFQVRGVNNVQGLTINTGSADVAIGSAPIQIAQITTITLTE